MRLASRLIGVPLIAGAFTLGLSGCGGADTAKTPEAALDVITKAFATEDTSQKANLGINIEFANTGQPKFVVKASGPYQSIDKKTAKFSLDAVISAEGATEAPTKLNFSSVGKDAYMTLGGQAFKLDTNSSEDSFQSNLSLKELGISPRSWVTGPKVVAEEKLDGEDVVHVAGGVDVAKFSTDMEKVSAKTSALAAGNKDAEQTLQGLDQNFKSAKMDVWATKDGNRLKRLVIDSVAKEGTIKLTVSLNKLVGEVNVTAPSKSLPFSELLKGLQQLQSSTSGSKGSDGDSSSKTTTTTTESSGATTDSGTSSGSAGSPGSASEDVLLKYQECVVNAGSDLAKLQKCSKYVE